MMTSEQSIQSSQSSHAFDNLVHRYFDDAISADELSALNQMLAADPDKVREFNDIALQVAQVIEHGGAQVGAEAIARDTEIPAASLASDSLKSARQKSGLSKLSPVLWPLAMAACLALFFSVFFNRGPVSSASPAVVQRGNDFVIEGKPDIILNSHLAPGSYELSYGVVQLRFASGAECNLEAPAAFEIVGPMNMSLTRGQMLARVTSMSKGFTVKTPEMTVKDLGTEFALAIDETGVTDVLVFDGLVEVAIDKKQEKRTVEDGGGLRLKGGQLDELVASEHLHRFVDYLSSSEPRRIGENLIVNHSFEVGPDITRGKRSIMSEISVPDKWRYENARGEILQKSKRFGVGLASFAKGKDPTMPLNQDGDRSIWISKGRMYQQMDARLSPNQSYEMVVAVGSDKDWGKGSRKANEKPVFENAQNQYHIELWAGEHLLSEIKGNLPAGVDFKDVKSTFDITQDHPGIGQAMKVVLHGSHRIFYDNVRIQARQ